MHSRTFLALTALFCLIVSPTGRTADATKPNEQRVRDYVAAFNKKDVETMLSMVTEDIQWLNVAGDKISVETQGKAKLRESMTGYFKSTPTAKSELEWVQATSLRVAALERASWQTKSGTKSQKSLSVYEFRGELIWRVYYYPAEK
jgi:ketosteroid isomerase-like protein